MAPATGCWRFAGGWHTDLLGEALSYIAVIRSGQSLLMATGIGGKFCNYAVLFYVGYNKIICGFTHV